MTETPKKVVNSTKKKSKPKLKGVAKTKTLMLGDDPPCGCCPDCVGKPSGTMGSCEDDQCVDLPPPDYFGVISYDPNRSPWKGPYWERPSQFPNAELQDLFNAMINTASQPTLLALAGVLFGAMDSTALSNLAALLKPYICPCDE